MKNKLFYTVLAILVLGFAYGCSTDDYLKEHDIQQMIDKSLNGQWTIIPMPVKKSEWKWNDKTRQYEVIYNLPQLTKAIYENGAILGYIFWGNQGVGEVQKPLPFVNTYSSGQDANGNLVTYTETISYDVQYADNQKSSVAFFIKDSQLMKDENAVQDYNFRIVLIW